MADTETVILNERVKAAAGLCDNAALAVGAAGVAWGFSENQIDWLVVGGVVLGFVLSWAAWHIRGLLPAEI